MPPRQRALRRKEEKAEGASAGLCSIFICVGDHSGQKLCRPAKAVFLIGYFLGLTETCNFRTKVVPFHQGLFFNWYTTKSRFRVFLQEEGTAYYVSSQRKTYKDEKRGTHGPLR